MDSNVFDLTEYRYSLFYEKGSAIQLIHDNQFMPFEKRDIAKELQFGYMQMLSNQIENNKRLS